MYYRPSVMTRRKHVSRSVRDQARDDLSRYFGEVAGPIVEKGIHAYCKQICASDSKNSSLMVASYHSNLENILFNVEQKGKTMRKLVRAVKRGEFNPYNIAFLLPEELNHDKWERIIVRRNTTEKLLNNLEAIEWFPCKTSGCGNVWHFFYQLQTRSGDEATTYFYICKSCSKTTRINR